MVAELLIICALFVGFAVGVLVGKCCRAGAPVVKPPPEHPEVAEVLPPPNLFMTPTSKTVYHLSQACHHIGGHSTIVRACKDCLREKARVQLRKRQKTMCERDPADLAAAGSAGM